MSAVKTIAVVGGIAVAGLIIRRAVNVELKSVIASIKNKRKAHSA